MLPEGVSLEDFEKKLKNINCKIGLTHTDLYELASLHRNKGELDYVVEFIKRNNIFYEGRRNRYTFAGTEYFARMKAQGLHTTDIEEIKTKVGKLNLTNILSQKLV